MKLGSVGKVPLVIFLLVLLSANLFASHGESYTYENSEKYFHLINWHQYNQMPST